MTLEHHDALLLLALLAIGVALLVVAPLVRVPYPILLVLGGLLLGAIPGLPNVQLDPTLVLVGILPPLLYSAAFFTSLRELRRNARAISSLALGLVLATTVTVATVAHYAIPGVSWPVAFVLGAVVAPTDPVAVTAIAERIGLPRRLVALVEGESLVNDATALVAYRFAVAAVVTGSFSLTTATWKFALSVVGGIGIGLAVGFVIREVRRRIDHSPTEIAIALFSGYFAYLPAEALDVSAVLAAVTVGIYVGWYTPELTNARTRLQGEAVWEIVTFMLNALLFTLVGLQLRPIVEGISGRSAGKLVLYAAMVSGVVIGARIVWVPCAAYIQWKLLPVVRVPERLPSRRSLALVSWTGMRGAVTLAAALAIPLSTEAGEPFPQRNLLIFLAFSVIVVTLVVQGLTLPLLVRLLRVRDDRSDEEEESAAWLHVAEAALSRLDELVEEEWAREATVGRLRDMYEFRRKRFGGHPEPDAATKAEQQSADFRRLRRELLDAERAALLDLSRSGRVHDEIAQRVQHELDLEDARLGS